YHVEKPRASHVVPKLFQYAGIATLSVGLAMATFNFAPSYINSWQSVETSSEMKTEVSAQTQRSLVANEPQLVAEPKPSKFALPQDIQQHLMQGTNRSLAIKDLYTLWGYQSS
ncbi:hypothetical protein AB4486_26595, partial [Vibrio sp. 10N.222.55.C6]